VSLLPRAQHSNPKREQISNFLAPMPEFGGSDENARGLVTHIAKLATAAIRYVRSPVSIRQNISQSSIMIAFSSR
jgi:hypothetical protein